MWGAPHHLSPICNLPIYHPAHVLFHVLFHALFGNCVRHYGQAGWEENREKMSYFAQGWNWRIGRAAGWPNDGSTDRLGRWGGAPHRWHSFPVCLSVWISVSHCDLKRPGSPAAKRLLAVEGLSFGLHGGFVIFPGCTASGGGMRD